MGRLNTTWMARRSPRRGFPRPKPLLALFVLVALAGAALAARWYWRHATLQRVTNQGLELLASADTPTRVAAALDAWERQTAGRWHHRRDDVIRYLLSGQRLADRRARLLLTRIAGVDYADRLEDWQRWFQTHQRLQAGQQPRVPRRQRVRLEPRWRAPVGLTAWFSTIIPLNGQIYVASLGAAFEDGADASDGVVRVDGATGSAELVFQPPGEGPRDVLGIAAGDDCLFATCRNGFLCCVSPGGALRWSARAGEPLSSAPLAIDVNRDGVTDVVAITHRGRVVAMSGRTGETAWVAPAPGGAAAAPVGATLTLGPVTADDRRDLLATTADGSIRVLAARNGALRWQGVVHAGLLAGAVCAQAGGPPAYVADRDGRVWSLLRAGDSLEITVGWDLIVHADDSLVASLRTCGNAGQFPVLLACPTGPYSARRAAVCALEPGWVRWRYAPPGTIWATPAVADLNGDGESELVVASIDSDDAGRGIGVLTVLSSEGHCLRQQVLPAPVECSPVVADVDGDNRLELLVADRAGWLHCFATGRIGPVEWGLFGGDSHNTRNAENAYRFGQTPAGVQWRWRPD